MNNLHACTKSVALHQVNKRHESDEGIFISNFAEKFLKRMQYKLPKGTELLSLTQVTGKIKKAVQ